MALLFNRKTIMFFLNASIYQITYRKPSKPLEGAIVDFQPYGLRIFSELFVIACNGMYTQGSMRLKQCQCLLLDHFEHGTRSMCIESSW